WPEPRPEPLPPQKPSHQSVTRAPSRPSQRRRSKGLRSQDGRSAKSSSARGKSLYPLPYPPRASATADSCSPPSKVDPGPPLWKPAQPRRANLNDRIRLIQRWLQADVPEED